MLQEQAYQKKYANAKHRDIEYVVGNKILLSTKNLRMHSNHKFGDRYVSPFIVLECIGYNAYHLDELLCAALKGIHNVFHVSLLHNWLSNRVPPI